MGDVTTKMGEGVEYTSGCFGFGKGHRYRSSRNSTDVIIVNCSNNKKKVAYVVGYMLAIEIVVSEQHVASTSKDALANRQCPI